MNQTRSNRTSTYLLLSLIISLLAFSGCKKPKPTPVDTYGTYGNGSNPELIDGTQSYGPYSTSASGGGGSTYVEGDYGADGRLSGGDGTYGSGMDGLEARDTSASGSLDAGLADILSSIYFDFDQSAVRPEDRPKLQSAAEYLSANPSTRLMLEGHCDWRGTGQYNLALGERRANAAFQYLTALGVSAGRLEVVSKGDIEAATEASESQMSQDRRVDIILLR